MGQRAAVFCHNGLGDGVNCLVLSNNLHLNGWKVETYQNTVGSMQNWFPHLSVKPYPSVAELPEILSSFDWFFVVQNDSDEFVLKLISEGKRRFPDRLKVIYFYPSKHIVNERYYGDCLTDPNLPVAENLRLFCEKILRLPKITRSNGFIPPTGLNFKKFPKRIVIHPTSAKPARNWPKQKFLDLASSLQSEGYEPVLIPGEKEKNEWEGFGFQVPVFPTLDALARFVYESGYFIGNDSGIGHLASALSIPTLTFCRRKALANLWAPSFNKGIVLTPSSLIPNIRGLRLRDRYWGMFISKRRAKSAFNRLVRTSTSSGKAS